MSWKFVCFVALMYTFIESRTSSEDFNDTIKRYGLMILTLLMLKFFIHFEFPLAMILGIKYNNSEIKDIYGYYNFQKVNKDLYRLDINGDLIITTDFKHNNVVEISSDVSQHIL